jgi:hypothetical protein
MTVRALLVGTVAVAFAAATVQAFAAPAAISDIRISFKLDARLSGPTYGSERWMATPTFSAAFDPVHVKADGIGRRGAQTAIAPRWTAADSAMVTISPVEGAEVAISVKRAGQTTIEVSFGGVSRTLSIKSSALPTKTFLVEFAQQPPGR